MGSAVVTSVSTVSLHFYHLCRLIVYTDYIKSTTWFGQVRSNHIYMCGIHLQRFKVQVVGPSCIPIVGLRFQQRKQYELLYWVKNVIKALIDSDPLINLCFALNGGWHFGDPDCQLDSQFPPLLPWMKKYKKVFRRWSVCKCDYKKKRKCWDGIFCLHWSTSRGIYSLQSPSKERWKGKRWLDYQLHAQLVGYYNPESSVSILVSTVHLNSVLMILCDMTVHRTDYLTLPSNRYLVDQTIKFVNKNNACLMSLAWQTDCNLKIRAGSRQIEA